MWFGFGNSNTTSDNNDRQEPLIDPPKVSVRDVPSTAEGLPEAATASFQRADSANQQQHHNQSLHQNTTTEITDTAADMVPRDSFRPERLDIPHLMSDLTTESVSQRILVPPSMRTRKRSFRKPPATVLAPETPSRRTPRTANFKTDDDLPSSRKPNMFSSSPPRSATRMALPDVVASSEPMVRSSSAPDSISSGADAILPTTTSIDMNAPVVSSSHADPIRSEEQEIIAPSPSFWENFFGSQTSGQHAAGAQPSSLLKTLEVTLTLYPTSKPQDRPATPMPTAPPREPTLVGGVWEDLKSVASLRIYKPPYINEIEEEEAQKRAAAEARAAAAARGVGNDTSSTTLGGSWFGWGRSKAPKPAAETVDLSSPMGPGQTARNALVVDSGDEIASKVPVTDGHGGVFGICCAYISGTAVASFLVFLILAAGLVYGLTAQLGFDVFKRFGRIDLEEELNVAFVGNAYFFVNDIPRVLESMSGGKVHQDSCLHAGGSLSHLLMTGNGMYQSWQTEEAVLSTDYDSNGKFYTTYDYGLCTVAQILQGYDEYVSYGNPNGTYYNDGLNPCIKDYHYDNYVSYKLANHTPKWDYVILADQTKRMAIPEARNDTVEALMYAYAPFIKKTRAIPVIVDTHAFWSDSSNMTGLQDIPTFTSYIYKGVDAYLKALSSRLPGWQAPIVAPIGLAYLTVWEENFDLWQSLFIDDGIHASLLGSYLFSVVLYATIYGHLPDPAISIPERMYYLFMNSRKLVGNSNTYPTTDEALYLQDVAKRVALKGYVPSCLKNL